MTPPVAKAEGGSMGRIPGIQWPGPKRPPGPDGAGLVLPDGTGRDFMARKFKEPVDVVLFGDTHEELIIHWDGVLLMNPGSPTYPGRRHKRGVVGTIGMLEGDGEDVTGRIINLEPPE